MNQEINIGLITKKWSADTAANETYIVAG